MQIREDEIKAITPQLNDKLMVVLSVIRDMRDEDMPVLDKLVQIEKDFRARLRATIPVVQPDSDRRNGD